jgi:hypothetical protein
VANLRSTWLVKTLPWSAYQSSPGHFARAPGALISEADTLCMRSWTSHSRFCVTMRSAEARRDSLRPGRQGRSLSRGRRRIHPVVRGRLRPTSSIVLPAHCRGLSRPVPARTVGIGARADHCTGHRRRHAKPDAAAQPRQLATTSAPSCCRSRIEYLAWLRVSIPQQRNRSIIHLRGDAALSGLHRHLRRRCPIRCDRNADSEARQSMRSMRS